MAPLIFYHFPPSAPSRAALWTIRYLGLDVDVKIVNLLEKEQLRDDFIKMNPQHCVPTLQDGDLTVWESRAIMTYLIDAKAPGNTMYPTDVSRRARINQMLYFDMGTMYTRIRNIYYSIIFLGETKIDNEKRKALHEAYAWLNGYLSGDDTKYVAGGQLPTVADISLMASITSAVQAGADIGKYENIVDWYDRCKSLAGFEENEKGAIEWGRMVKRNLNDTF